MVEDRVVVDGDWRLVCYLSPDFYPNSPLLFLPYEFLVHLKCDHKILAKALPDSTRGVHSALKNLTVGILKLI